MTRTDRPSSASPSRLSAAGSALLAEASASIAAIERQMLVGLSQAEHDALRSALQVCAANLM